MRTGPSVPGGHSLVIGKNLTGKGRLICLDRDPDAVSLSKKRLSFLGDRVSMFKANFADLDKIIRTSVLRSLTAYY